MDVEKLISEMTLEEKASLLSGLDAWRTKPVGRLGVPSYMVSDGPHGLRKQAKGSNDADESIKAVCFPCGCAAAASFDRDALMRIGEAIGEAAHAEGLSVVLGPAVNIKRSPLCGRNFEYYSEDPYLASTLAASMIEGIQKHGVGACIKHFAANNQEHRRMSVSAEIDERTLREIYLAAFESAVKNAKPWTVMSSYNRINGTFSSESDILAILRDEWGFDGYVMSDWGAVADRVKALQAGLDLEMPGSHGINDELIVKAVETGELDETVVDRAVRRILTVKKRLAPVTNTDWDKETQHELAAELAAECAVLLKNENAVLPLSKTGGPVAFIGLFAAEPRFQGGGSSHINCFKTSSALEAARDLAVYAPGYDITDTTCEDTLIAEAVECAKTTRAAVVFAGLPDALECEAYDREHMRLPDCQNKLITAVAAVNPNTVVVLHNGSPIEMPWIDNVKAVLEMYLGGQGVGQATVKLLFGDKNPSGKLPESFPVALQDNPSYLFFPGEGDKSEYREGIFVGYRYYDKKGIKPLFPFGHGLSYTSFGYSNPRLSADAVTDADELVFSFDIENTGAREGAEAAQLYVAAKNSKIPRAVRELRGFEKLRLNPGEKKTVSFTLSKRDFAYWDTEIHDWRVEDGEYELQAARSSRDIALSVTIKVSSTAPRKRLYTKDSILLDLQDDGRAMAIVEPLIKAALAKLMPEDDSHSPGDEAITREMKHALLRYMPLRKLLGFMPVKPGELIRLLDELNEKTLT